MERFPLSVEHPVTYLRATSSSEKHQYLPEYTEASKSKKPPYPLACFSVLVPVVIPPVPALPHLYLWLFFFLSKYSFSERVHLKEDILTANTLHSFCWTVAGLQSKVYIPGLLGGMLPSGALDQTWGLQVRDHGWRLGCSVTGKFWRRQAHWHRFLRFNFVCHWWDLQNSGGKCTNSNFFYD